MSLESGIIEEILEEFDSVESIEDDAKSDKSKRDEDGERIGRTDDSNKGDNGLNGAKCVHEDITDIAECKCKVVIIDDINPKDYLVIEEYSNTLAENIVQEAVLINEIYTRDRKTGTSKPGLDLPMNKDKLLGQMEAKSPGYDQYIIDKFLHSQADPLDTEDDVGFDGKEEYFRSELDWEGTYPGLNEEDSYIQGQISRSLPDEESDKNNNRLSGNLIDPFNEALQTIHEGEMLVIEDDFRQNGAPEMTSSVNDVRYASPKGNEDTRGLDQGENEVNTHQDILPDETQTPQQHVAFADEAPPESRESRISNADDASEASDANDAGELPVERPEVMEGLPEEEDEEEEEDGEPDCCEMTPLYYGESLLMVAIRSGQLTMAEFLVDNGVDRYHRHKLVEREANGGFSVHFIDARQMAYDTGMHELVEFLDFKANSLFPFIRPKLRDPHLRQPIAPFTPPALDEAMPIEMFIDPDEVVKLIAEERKRLAAEKIARELEMAEMRIKARKGKLANVENESVHNEMESNSLNDELSQVFGPDVGFDNMHPGSLLVKHDYNIPDMTKHVSVRGTRSSHLARQVNTNKAERLRLERNEPKRGTKEGEVETNTGPSSKTSVRAKSFAQS
ncbi:hypothetical protein MAR_012428 [Mya arenaria]|uniref:Uncharacterized protein n=1 Tax=Mya arenaria TaxID=6604 RepID=A0ABY7FZZ2_MYAAR|nr:hypothetical protein MAR_012428 [Mya arenaria]